MRRALSVILLAVYFAISAPSTAFAVGPIITSQPTNLTVNAGNFASFSVTTTGSLVGYQWYFNGSPIFGAVGSTYSLLAADASNAGNYYVTAGNISGTVTSSVVTLTVIKSNANISLGNLLQVYTGSGLGISVDTFPLNLLVSITYNGSTSAPTNPGVYSVVVTINSLLFSGSATNTLSIIKPLTISGLVASNKVYDGTVSATINSSGATLSGLVGTDSLTLSGTPTGTFSDANVGTGKSVTVAGLTLSGPNAAGYSLTLPTLVANITQASTLNVVSSSANPSSSGTNVTFTATLNAVSPGAGLPTGNVIFKDGATILGSNALTASATATFGTALLSHGTHTITAIYVGDGNFIGVTNTLTETIDAPPVVGADTLSRSTNCWAKVRISTLLANDSDPDGDAITFVSTSATSTSGYTVAKHGKWISYEPASGFAGSDSFTYSITDSYSRQASGTVTISMAANNAAAQNWDGTQNQGGNSVQINFSGIPGRTYTIQYSTNVVTPSWQALGAATAGTTGVLNFTDAPPTNGPARFYRSINP